MTTQAPLALITGASAGIGAAIAHELAAFTAQMPFFEMAVIRLGCLWGTTGTQAATTHITP